MRNRTFMPIAHDDSLLGAIRFVSRYANNYVYGAIVPKAMTDQALLDSVAYKTYYAIASGAKPLKSRKSQKKFDSAISSEETPSKKKSAKAKKVAATKPKPTKKKATGKADRGKGLNVLSEVALFVAAQLKEATKRSKKDFHISQESGSGDGTDFESGVPDEQHRKTLGTDEGTGTKPGVLDVPKYDSESEKESWGDSGEEDDDDENDSEDKSNDGDDDDDDGNNGNGDDDDDANDDDNKEDDDTNDDDEETGSDRTESDIIKIPVLNQSRIEYYEEEEEKIDDEEMMDEEEDDEVTKELYNDVNVNLVNRDADMTDADQGGADQQNVSQESGFEQVEEDAHVTLTPVLDTQKTDEPVQSSSVFSDFTSKLLNLKNPSLADNEIASLMDTTVLHEEPRSQTSSLYTVLVTATPDVTFVFTTTIPQPPPFFNPLPQQATPTPTPTTSEATTSFPSLPDFLSVFKFNNRVTNLEKDLSEIKQVDQYAQALSSIPDIVDHYIDNKLGKAIQKAIVAHNLDCREEAQADKRDYIELVDTSMRIILKVEFNTQLPQILPQAVLDFVTPMIEKNVIESLKAAVLARSSSQPKSTYEAIASLFEFELTKILIDKMEKNKSYDKADYKKELYDALVKSYQTYKDLFDTYGEVFTLKRSRDDRDKDQDPSAGSDEGRKEGSQARKLSKSAHAEEPSHTVDNSGVQQDQEFDTGNNDEQPANKEVSKDDWFKKPERPLTPDSDWNKRQHIDFRPPQTWISQVARAKEPHTSFDELMDTSFYFSAFVLNRLNIKDLTQEILVGLAFELLKGTCKSLTKLEYHLEDCSKATTERLDWHNPEGKPYPFDLSKPLPLIPDHRGRQVIPQDFFINNDLEYLKGVIYDKHAYFGTSHWGPKSQRFYGFASNMTSSKDVYSRKRIIAVTKLTIMKMYDYGHLGEIEVRREDQQLYKFR
ncbi:hypothetical protein Tco_0154993 [Tanacetum coccineum]